MNVEQRYSKISIKDQLQINKHLTHVIIHMITQTIVVEPYIMKHLKVCIIILDTGNTRLIYEKIELNEQIIF
jgi:hypothetical protein